MRAVAGAHETRPSPAADPDVVAVATYAQTGGGEHLLVDLLGALAARGVAVELVLLGDGPVRTRAEARAVPVTVAPRVRMTRPHTVVAGVWALRRRLRATAPTVVHASNPKAHLLAHLAVTGLACASTVQVLDAPGVRDPFARATRHLDGLRLAITPEGAQAWQRAAPGRPVRLLEPGVDRAGLTARAATGDAAAAWAAAGLPHDDAPRVVMVARLQRYKGVFDFVDLAARAAPRTNARFLLVGPDEPLEPGTRAALVAEIAAQHLDRRVAVSMPLPEADLAAVMADATLVVHPAHVETFGLVVVEALALGTPVVAYAAPGPARILAGGGGAVVPLGDRAALTEATLALLADPGRRTAWAATGRARAADFDLARTADGYLAAVRSLGVAVVPTGDGGAR